MTRVGSGVCVVDICVTQFGDAIHSAIAFSLNDEFAPILKSQMEYYNRDPSADSISQVRVSTINARRVLVCLLCSASSRGCACFCFDGFVSALDHSCMCACRSHPSNYFAESHITPHQLPPLTPLVDTAHVSCQPSFIFASTQPMCGLNVHMSHLRSQVKTDLNDVRHVMVQNIEKVLERGEKIELLVDKTDRLNQTAFKFEKSSKQLQEVEHQHLCDVCGCDVHTAGCDVAWQGLTNECSEA